eukprot:CAMPEP_0113936752 /NCGR_PEP_ID=MMETSP1339-20121228/3567_1 /TAXON_ID=94617 /ORGANISM="Fibrocapsa japonica" /LENGTH=242 /DNA_ID=CAMNT_0000939303 /DNA_START=333 /DNA_END=1061 /DNA_ORIENTATION=+ /assembly_acc=CAM_ASM_000762
MFSTYGQALKLLGAEEPAQGSSSPLSSHFMAGAAGGFAISLVLSPCDLIKCRLQVDKKVASISSGAESTRAFVDCIRKTFRKDGLLGFYQGYQATFLRETVGCAVYFTIYVSLKRQLLKWSYGGGSAMSNPAPSRQKEMAVSPASWKMPEALASAIAGAAAGSVGWFCIFPIDSVKSRLQTLPRNASQQEKKILNCFANIYQTGGIRAFYKGVGPVMMSTACAGAAVFPTYEFVSKALSASS